MVFLYHQSAANAVVDKMIPLHAPRKTPETAWRGLRVVITKEEEELLFGGQRVKLMKPSTCSSRQD